MEHDPDHHLARGNPGGPKLDALWQRVAPQVLPAAVPFWKRPWVWGGAPLLALVAGVLWVKAPAPQEFAARGSGEAGALGLESTCGQPGSAPCRVGQPVMFRVHHAPPGGVLYVLMVDGTGWARVAGPLTAQGEGPVPVPAQVTPDMRDVASGVALRVVWLPKEPAGGSPGQWLADPGARVARASLAVVPAP